MSKNNRIEFPQLNREQYQILSQRQDGLCALSGEPLNETVIAHHIVPANHQGTRNEVTNEFVRDLDKNCVLVNEEPELDVGKEFGAHLRSHGGNFNNGPAATHSAFKYSHGNDTSAHEKWATEQEKFVDKEIWGERSKSDRNNLMENQSAESHSIVKEQNQTVSTISPSLSEIAKATEKMMSERNSLEMKKKNEIGF